MGLYDHDEEEPVPRFVADDKKKDKNKKDKSPQEDGEYLESVSRLFVIEKDGREARDLLPRLSRTLESGVECYFEVADRQVQNLARKTACHPMDAAWALEACKGDVTEAWLAISTARRLLLNEQEDEEDDFDAELFEMLQQNKELLQDDEEGFDERKERISKEEKEQARKQAMKDAFNGLEPDADWLPTKNPNPVDDEPWFTG